MVLGGIAVLGYVKLKGNQVLKARALYSLGLRD